MESTSFSKIAARYEKDSLVQKSASEPLFDLLSIGGKDDVLDLGCGTGHLTKEIRQMTSGNIIGVDPAQGMIEKAQTTHGHLNINFEVCSAEELSYVDCFDIIFCNSTFQWFNPPRPVLENCYRALRNNGRMGIQAPAQKIYSPNFVSAVKNASVNPKTKKEFAHFKDPWFFLETSGDYATLFENVGFTVTHSIIEKVVTPYAPDKVFAVFDSGAAAGYLNTNYYDVPISKEYLCSFREIVKDSFAAQVNESGYVDLVFFRIYLLAQKHLPLS